MNVYAQRFDTFTEAVDVGERLARATGKRVRLLIAAQSVWVWLEGKEEA